MFRHILFVCLSAVLIACSPRQSLVAQESIDADRRLNISMTAEKAVPADLLIFQIVINSEGDDPQEAYRMHKEKEAYLADILKEFEISESDIDYQLMRMNKQYDNRKGQDVIRTSQSISVQFTDTDLYEEIQLRLIENGFNGFSARFSASDLGSAKEAAMRAAISKANEQARIMADASGSELGPILTMSYSDYNVGPANTMRADAAMIESSSSMLDFEKTILIRASVSLTYRLQ